MSTVTTPDPQLDAPSPSVLDAMPRVAALVRRVPQWLWITVGLIGLMALSTYMRSRYLSHQFWIDEAITTGVSTHALTDIPHVLRYDGNPPFYYLLLHIWDSWFGDSEAATRSLSLLFGILTIPAGGWGAWKLFGRRAGVFAAILFAFNSWLTAYAQETRMYELMALLGVVATIAMLQAFVYRRRGWLPLYSAMLLAMLYTHSWGTFFYAGSAIALIPALVASDDRRRFFLDALMTYGAAIILWLPWVPTFLFQAAHTAAPWDSSPRFGAPIQISRDLLGGDRITIVILGTAIIGLGPVFTRRFRRTTEATLMWTLILLPIAVLALGWLVSQRNPAWAPRYFAPVLGAVLFLIAWGCAKARVLGFVAILVALLYLHNPASFAPGNKSNMRQVSAQVTPYLHPGDLVIVGQPESIALNWYYLPGGLRFADTASYGKVVPDPRYLNWANVLHKLKSTRPDPSLNRLLATVHVGQRVLFVRPLTEGAQNWQAPWTLWVRRRSAQWSQALTNDVTRGILTPVTTAPDTYVGACCVADSAVLYRKVKSS